MTNPPSLWHKVYQALLALPRSLRPTRQPRLVMTLLVKNEADILAANLEFHHAMGVDAFVITDNASTDDTPSIIRAYQERGWVRHVIHEPATGYEQKRWVDRMVDIARRQLGADWIINADADEFWWSPTGNLKDDMRRTRGNVLRCPSLNVMPQEDAPLTAWRTTVRPVPEALRQTYGLCPYSHFNPQRGKVAHRADGYLQISMGNHKVAMLPHRARPCSIVIYHYSLRGKTHFLNKMVTGGRELLAHGSRHGGAHWRYFYALHQEGRLAEAYDQQVMATSHTDALRQAHYLVDDNPLPAWFAAHPLPPLPAIQPLTK